MSKYTTEVRFICETLSGLDESVGYNDVAKVIESARSKIFDFDYPIFDTAYKSVLETKILKHYYTREIGLETVGLWKLKLDTRMNEIMPFYNKMYRSELLEFNPFYDVDITRDHQRTNNDISNGNNVGSGSSENSGTNSDSSKSKDTNWNLFQDTPQNGLTDVDQMNYLSAATKVSNTGSVRSKGSSSGESSYNSSNEYANAYHGVEDYLEHVKGTNGGLSFSKKLEEYRKTFLNLDLKVIDELKDLFIYLW